MQFKVSDFTAVERRIDSMDYSVHECHEFREYPEEAGASLWSETSQWGGRSLFLVDSISIRLWRFPNG
jgi:hypothetical protein